jgi:glycerophosphoryl diester phosphodiesterase
LSGRIVLYGHRGGAAEAPENSVAAIRHARAAGAAGVELDLRRTADDRLVVCHDADLARVAGRPERIAALPAAELTAVELVLPAFPAARERLPALETALAEAVGLALDLELKC